MTNHMPTNHGLWMNYNTYSKLSERQQQACWDAAYEASIWMDGQIAEAEEEYKQTCIVNGMTVIDEESGLDIAAFQAAGMTMYLCRGLGRYGRSHQIGSALMNLRTDRWENYYGK